MYVAQIINGEAYNVSIAPHITDIQAFVDQKEDYILIDEQLDNDSFYDYIEGEIVLNVEKTTEILIAKNKDFIEDLVAKVNKKAFIDSETMPSMEQVMILFNYVAELKEATTVIPDPPSYVLGLLMEE